MASLEREKSLQLAVDQLRYQLHQQEAALGRVRASPLPVEHAASGGHRLVAPSKFAFRVEDEVRGVHGFYWVQSVQPHEATNLNLGAVKMVEVCDRTSTVRVTYLALPPRPQPGKAPRPEDVARTSKLERGLDAGLSAVVNFLEGWMCPEHEHKGRDPPHTVWLKLVYRA